MSSSPGSDPPRNGPSSDDTAQIPAVRPSTPEGATDGETTMPGVAGHGIGPVDDDTAQFPAIRPETPAAGGGSAAEDVTAPRMVPPVTSGPPTAGTPSGGSPPAGTPSSAPPGGPAGWTAPPRRPEVPVSGAPGQQPSWEQPGPPPGWGAPGGQPVPGASGEQPVPGAPAQPPVPGMPGEAPTTALPSQPPGWGMPGQPPATPPGAAPKPRKWLIPAAAGGAAIVLLLTLTGGVMAFAGEVPRGTTVLGVDIGGRSRAEAAKALRAGLGKRVDKPVKVRIGDATATVDPKQVRLAIDYQATARRAVQPWPNPFTVLFGEREVEPVVKVDADKLDTVLQKLGASVTEKLTRPAIRYDDLTPKPIYPDSGRGLDPKRSAQAMRAGWLRGGAVKIPIVKLNPVTSKADVDKLLKELAEPAVAAPVTVETPEGSFTISRKAIAKSLLMESDKRGEIVPKVHGKKLHKAAKQEFAKVETPAKDATMAVRGGKLVTTGEKPGSAVDLDKLTKVLLPVLRESAPREVSAKFTEAKPKLTREKIGKLGIKQKISSFTTYFKGGQDRNKNILIIADEVDNALVMPGKTFSLNGYTGQRSYAQGYVDAPVIINGKIKNYVGGGISQFATTLFNASYYAGMVDVYHKPHGYYISRYPSVIEATVFYPSLDLKFKNDSKHGVLIDTSYTDRSITVSFWSTKRYEIKTKWEKKYDWKDPETKHLYEKDCIETSGIRGFKQVAYRIFRRDGREIKREKFFWHYKAEPKFVCHDPDEKSPSPS